MRVFLRQKGIKELSGYAILVYQEPNVWAFNVLEDFSSHKLLELLIFLMDICKKKKEDYNHQN